jgi:hypothetical protein
VVVARDIARDPLTNVKSWVVTATTTTALKVEIGRDHDHDHGRDQGREEIDTWTNEIGS